ncbi:MAG: prolipoprotein diacylglyceryl transferase [Lachnospiraceae bacterium]|nr:prolipoprotein diacylglyceryl transferase [Lachnospiraceae bacterium]
MYNDLFSIGPFTVHGYGLMIAIGIAAAYVFASRVAKKRNLSEDEVFNILMVALVGGFASSKCLFYLTILPEILKDPGIILRTFSSGWVVFGGIIGGILAVMLYCKIRKIDFLSYADFCMPAVALAQGFGRIGCLLAGCCYGVATSSKFAITFTHSDFAPNNIALFPAEPVMSVLDFLHFGILTLIMSKSKKKGTVTICYLIFYSIGRFIIEFYRGDLERGSVGVLSTSQFISIFVCIAGMITLFVRAKKACSLVR